MNTSQKIKQKIWSILYRVFPWAEHHLLSFHQKQRQKFHLGWIHPSKSLADLKNHLSNKWQFGNHFVAWEDSSQVLSWRKLVSFDKQYHIRVYDDGEIRGHFEYTPESAPLKHFFEEDETAGREGFMKFLDGYMVDKKYQRHIEREPALLDPDSEKVFMDNKK